MGVNWEGYELLQLCSEIAKEAHEGDFRRDGLTPYIDHPIAVVRRLSGTKEKCVGWLHDVVEDTHITLEGLLEKGVPQDIVDGVDAMTKRAGESYTASLYRARSNALSKAVKEEDMLHNLSDFPTRKQIIKYSKGLLFLLEED